jgi:hypothetical protein
MSQLVSEKAKLIRGDPPPKIAQKEEGSPFKKRWLILDSVTERLALCQQVLLRYH